MNCSGAEICRYLVSLLWADGFICAIALLTLVKNTLDTRTIRGLGLISRHSLGIYGFHALIIHALRTRGIELKIGQYWILFGSLRDVGSEFVTFYAGTTNRQKQISELSKSPVTLD